MNDLLSDEQVLRKVSFYKVFKQMNYVLISNKLKILASDALIPTLLITFLFSTLYNMLPA